MDKVELGPVTLAVIEYLEDKRDAFEETSRANYSPNYHHHDYAIRAEALSRVIKELKRGKKKVGIMGSEEPLDFVEK